MKMAEKVLRRLDGEDTFTAAKIERVSAIIEAYNEERSLMGKKTALPTRFIEIGGEVEVRGHRFRCVEADRVSVPAEACSGCSLSKLYLRCGDLQCGCFDRRDKKIVWFKEVKK